MIATLLRATSMSRIEAKRLVNSLLKGGPFEVLLADSTHLESMTWWLDTIGAHFEVTKCEP